MLTGTELWAVAEEAMRSKLWDRALARYEARLAHPKRKRLLHLDASLQEHRGRGFEVWAAAEDGGDVRAAAMRVQGGAVPGGAVAVIPVYGLLVQHASWYMCSTEEVQHSLAIALGMPEISAIVLRFHSPGGSLYGTQVLADQLRALRGGPKPILGHADSAACSAAYWLLVSCAEAWATPGGDVASIGAYVEHQTTVEMDKQIGKRTLIRMPEGKALTWEGQELSEEARQYLLARVTNSYDAFVAGVAKARGVGQTVVRGEEWGKGRVIQAEAAAKLKLIDGVRPLAETVQAAAKLARTQAGRSGTRAEAEPPAPPEPSPEPCATASDVDRLLGEELLRSEAGA